MTQALFTFEPWRVELLVAAERDERRAEMFAAADRVLVYSRHHWLYLAGEAKERDDLKTMVAAMKMRAPSTWSASEAELLHVLHVLDAAVIGLEQLDRDISVAALAATLDGRMALYERCLGARALLVHPDDLLEKARLITRLRGDVDAAFHRYSDIDGQRWFRTEGAFRRSEVPLDDVPGPLLELLRRLFPRIAFGGDHRTYFKALARASVTRFGESLPLVRTVMAYALVDPRLDADHATLTCPRGVLLATPELMNDRAHFLKHTEVRPELDLEGYEGQLGHASIDRMAKIICARMQKLKFKAVKNFYHPGCLMGQLIEKACDNMIFHHEDAHYPGHRQAGVSTGGRAAFDLAYRADGRDMHLNAMLADFRVVRLSHDVARRFTPENLAAVILYSRWLKCIVETTFDAGGVVSTVAEGEECPHVKKLAEEEPS